MTDEQRIKKAARQRAYYAANREAELAKQRERRAADPEKYKTRRSVKYWKDPQAAREASRAYYAKNKDHAAELARQYRAQNPEKIRARKRRAAYGITEEQYLEMWRAQNGRCAICIEPLVEEDRKTHVDHCHVTGLVRGLLCADCNVGLGRFKDRPEVLERAAAYVRVPATLG